MPAYRPSSYPGPDGNSGTRGYKHAGTALLAGPPPISGPMPAYRGSRNTGPGPVVPGKRIPGWLPFSNRLLLLPKGLAFDGDGELHEHRDSGGGWLRPAVFGAMDGLVTNSSLIAGIGGGGGGHGMIVLTGIAGLIAGAFSMATGEYISVKSQNELTAAEVELERRQHAQDPEGKRTRRTELYMEKGVSPTWPKRWSGRSRPTWTGPSLRMCARNLASTQTTCLPRKRRRSRLSPRSPWARSSRSARSSSATPS
jgi:hypothetical protein